MQIFTIFILFMASTSQVFADTAVTTTVQFGGFLSFIQPYVMEVVSAVLSAVTAYVVFLIRAKFNVDIDKTMADRLQATILNAAGLLWQKVGPEAANMKIDVKNPAVAQAVQYVLDNGPAMLKHFNITDPQVIADKIAAKIGQLAAPTAPVPPTQK